MDVIIFRKDGGRKASYVPLFTSSVGWPRVEGHHKSLQPSPDPRTWLQEQKEGHGDSACGAGYLKGESQGLPLLPDTDEQGFMLKMRTTDLIRRVKAFWEKAVSYQQGPVHYACILGILLPLGLFLSFLFPITFSLSRCTSIVRLAIVFLFHCEVS